MMAVELKKTETFIEHDIVAGGVNVGTVELCLERHEISWLVIYEPYRNNGYGTEVVRRLAGDGYTSLWVRSDNDGAIRLYERCGFEKSGETMFEMRLRGDA